MTIDQAMADPGITPEQFWEMTKPTKVELVLLFFQHLLGSIFPWMAPIPDPDDW